MLKPVVWVIVGVAHFITGHKQAQFNQTCLFHFSSLHMYDLTFQNLLPCKVGGVSFILFNEL